MDLTYGITSSERLQKKKGKQYIYHIRRYPGIALCKVNLVSVIIEPTGLLCRKCEVYASNKH